MSAFNKILLILYYILWTAFLVSAYSILTDRFYQVGYLFAKVLGVFITFFTFLAIISLIIFYYLRTAKRKIYSNLIKLTITPLFLLIPFFNIKAIPGQLEKTTRKVTVMRIVYGCECADWELIDGVGEIVENNVEDIFIEPANNNFILPDTIGFSGDVVELTGQFYTRKGFPKGYYSSQLPDKARVFRYSKFRIIISNHYTSTHILEK